MDTMPPPAVVPPLADSTDAPAPLSGADAIPEEFTVTFASPVTFVADIVYDKAVLREPTVGQWAQFDKLTGVEANRMAASVVGGPPLAVIDRLSIADFKRMTDYLELFFSAPVPAAKLDPEAMPAEFEIRLLKPIEHDGASLASMALREPTVADWNKWDKETGLDADILAVSLVSGLSEATIRRLGVRDMRNASEYVGRFFVRAPATGAPS